MNEFGIISLAAGVAFLLFAIFIKPDSHKPKHHS